MPPMTPAEVIDSSVEYSSSTYRDRSASGTDSAAYDGLLYTVFQQLRASSAEGIVVALTSANSGEGVTHSVTALVGSLCKDSSARILHIDSRRLREANCTPERMLECCRPIDRNISEFTGERASGFSNGLDFDLATGGTSVGTDGPANPQGNAQGYSWEGNWEYRRDCIAELRAAFDYILIDCPAIKTAGDVFSLAPLVDGVIMVVEAGKTRAEQILHAERSIDFARGRLIGHILNKRTFTVPHWLYKRL